jgi:hypothetical protein
VPLPCSVRGAMNGRMNTHVAADNGTWNVFKSLKVAALATVILCPSLAQAAKYELGSPFPMTCEGILEYRGGEYSLNLNLDQRDQITDDDRICNSATVAEESKAPYTKYSLRKKAISHVFKTCSLGKPCRIVGYMNCLSHNVYFLVKITSASDGIQACKRTKRLYPEG